MAYPKWSYDANYVVTSPFGVRKDPFSGVDTFHRGIDLVGDSSTCPIYAFVAGIVTHAKEGATGTGLGNYGNVVGIKDDKGHLHLYAHLSMVTVRVGQTVTRGQMVGRMGSTGKSTGPHLHYEVRKAAAPSFGYTATEAGVVNPTEYLEEYYKKTGVAPLSEANKVVEQHVNVVVNGKKIDDGLLINGVTYAPVRDLTQALGVKIQWDQKTSTVTVSG
jgi:murein DD-endopeptidase MepM/ murein hydrolase activator NlpD